MLAAGVVGLLMFNTHMQQASFNATALQDRVDVAHRQGAGARPRARPAPRPPAAWPPSAKKLGMVAPSQPAFVRLSDGRILGTPTPATAEDACGSTRCPQARPSRTPIKRKRVSS